MNALSHDGFQQMCDHLSGVVDAVQYERMRWARDIGPRLADLVALTLAAIEPRADLEFTEERSITELKRYILKVHSIRVIGIALWIKDGKAHIQPIEIERSKFALSADDAFSVELDGVNADWIANALKEAFGLIVPREEPMAVVAEAAQSPLPASADQLAIDAPPRLRTLRIG